MTFRAGFVLIALGVRALAWLNKEEKTEKERPEKKNGGTRGFSRGFVLLSCRFQTPLHGVHVLECPLQQYKCSTLYTTQYIMRSYKRKITREQELF